MEVLVVLVVIGIIGVVIASIRSRKEKPPARTTSTTQRPPDSSSVRTKRDPNVYRPSTSTQRPARPAIEFKVNGGGVKPSTALDIKDLVDALTGAPLQLSSELYQCQRCEVFYQDHSMAVIRSENGGRCVSCLDTKIISVTGRREQRGRNADVSVITLDNYRQYVGQAITFEGQVYQVLTSRRGTDHAVMFENRNWVSGFKMVVFMGDVGKLGGVPFLDGLVGHQVKVRGLLKRHETYGYEIIVHDPVQILGVQ